MKSPSILSRKEGYGVFWCLLIHVDVTMTVDLILYLTWVVFSAAEMHLMSLVLVPV